MKIYYDLEQGTEEWFKIRKLKLSGSGATAIGSNGAGLKTLVKTLMLDCILPDRDKFTGSKDTERGQELEPIAKMKYEFEYGSTIIDVGFVERCKFSGYSPDSLVEVDKRLNEGKGLLEIKARNDEKHLNLLITEKVDSSTIWQMNHGMLVTEREWCDFISYNPNFKQSLFVKRFYKDEEKQTKLLTGLDAGIKMIKKLLQEQVVKLELNR